MRHQHPGEGIGSEMLDHANHAVRRPRVIVRQIGEEGEIASEIVDRGESLLPISA